MCPTCISQDSLATCIRCGGICNSRFIADLLLSVPMNELENRSIFGEDMDKSILYTPVRSRVSFLDSMACFIVYWTLLKNIEQRRSLSCFSFSSDVSSNSANSSTPVAVYVHRRSPRMNGKTGIMARIAPTSYNEIMYRSTVHRRRRRIGYM